MSMRETVRNYWRQKQAAPDAATVTTTAYREANPDVTDTETHWRESIASQPQLGAARPPTGPARTTWQDITAELAQACPYYQTGDGGPDRYKMLVEALALGYQAVPDDETAQLELAEKLHAVGHDKPARRR